MPGLATVQNTDIDAYISRFSELSLLCSGMITSEGKKIEIFNWRFTSPIQRNVIDANPATYDSVKRLVKKLYDHGNKKGAKVWEIEVKKEGGNKKGKNNKQKVRQTQDSLKQ